MKVVHPGKPSQAEGRHTHRSQGLLAVPQRASAAAAEEAAERDLFRALHDRLRRRRDAAGLAPGVLRGYPVLVVRCLPHDGDDVWRAMMQKHRLPKEDQAKFLGANARRLYKVQAPAN